jgi:xanthine dehydrogenase accessory factor
MSDVLFAPLFSTEARPLAIILGTNEIASATAVRLNWEGNLVILSHDPFPPVIRRGMAFHDALFEDRAEVDGITGGRAESLIEIADVLAKPGHVVVTPLQLTDLIALRSPDALIDARMQKYRVTPDLRGICRLTVGFGPNFEVGVNCDIAVETHPARTGKLVEKGATDRADGVARDLGGVGRDRFVYSDRAGTWRTAVDIGMRIFKGMMLGNHDGAPVYAPMDGYLRGIARDATFVPHGVKILEIDPRGRAANWTGSDQRGRAIAEATVKAMRVRAAQQATARALRVGKISG